MQVAFHAFINDTKVHIALLLVALDFVFGVIAAFKLGTFRMSYMMDFLKNDILFKLFPYFVLYWGSYVAGGEDAVVPGFDMGIIAGAVYAGLVAAWTASILNSLMELRLPSGNQSAAVALTADENGDAFVPAPVKSA